MIQKIYSLYDKLTTQYNTPIVVNDEKVLLRDLQECITNKKIPHYQDLVLYNLGEFDTTNGKIKNEIKKIIELKKYEPITKQ